jgi:hypothetical protein
VVRYRPLYRPQSRAVEEFPTGLFEAEMGELNIATCRLLVSGKAAQLTRGHKRGISQISER